MTRRSVVLVTAVCFVVTVQFFFQITSKEPAIAEKATDSRREEISNLLRYNLKARNASHSAPIELASSPPSPLSTIALAPYESPLLLFTCRRPHYLKETLDYIIKYIPHDCSMGCPFIISQDGDDVEVAKVIQKAQVRFQEQANVSVIHWQHSKPQAISNAYEALAIHYGWALQKLFSNASLDEPNDSPFPRRVLILEEDLHVAPDFFDYFTSMAPILDQDSSVYAVSAFNDNGFRGKVKDVTRVLRTDFFPGLGWMMTRRLWEEELQQKWPRIYWDGWLRLGAQRKGRHTLRPEVSRTFHFGTMGGASGNQYGGLLQRIQLNSERVDWSKRNLTNLSITDEYDRQYWKLIRSAKRVQTREEALQHCNATNVLIEYKDLEDFRIVAKDLELMVDNKDGILRTSYKGVVETRPCGNNLLFLTPPFDELRRSFQLVANM